MCRVILKGGLTDWLTTIRRNHVAVSLMEISEYIYWLLPHPTYIQKTLQRSDRDIRHFIWYEEGLQFVAILVYVFCETQ